MKRYLRRGAMCLCFLIVLMALAVLALTEAAYYWLEAAAEAWDEFRDGWEEV